ncbi:MAG: heavy metal translocating P-type ATPase [Caulobacteraceae bacterium]
MSHDHHAHVEAPPDDGKTAKDPVCGMRVNPITTAHRTLYEGVEYVFCCNGCRVKFEADPAKYLNPQPEPKPAIPGAIYTCPMHPEVRQEGPGACPKCGMALEPEDVTADAGPNPEIADFTRRLIVGAVLTIPLVVMDMGQHLISLPPGLTAPGWLELILATPVVFWAGYPFIERAIASVANRSLNMFSLIALGSLSAWTYSVIAALFPTVIPMTFRGMGEPPLYFEAAAVITCLVLLGQLLEVRARDRASGAIRALFDLRPPQTLRVREGQADETIPVEHVHVGDLLRVRPGEKIPVDGRLVEGASAVDESLITGEAMPIAKAIGAKVVAGSLNGSGGFVMAAEKVGRDTLLAGIVALVAAAQRSRAPIHRVADRVSGIFVPAVIAVAVLAFAAWAYIGPEPRLGHAFVAAIGVLIIACPCALGLATPMSIMVGMGRAATAGVLFRDAAALERLEAVNTVVFDKTGSLTEGRPSLVGDAEDEVLRLAASLEQGSEHPLAGAILRAAKDRDLTLEAPSSVVAALGEGLGGSVGGRTVLLGAARYLRASGVEPLDGGERGASHVHVAIDGRAAGVLSVRDPVRAAARPVLEGLRAKGVRVLMLTGDSQAAAEAVAAELGITEVHVEVSPAGKAERLKALKAEGRITAMLGDGVNDAPALALADVGIAMGAGADVAVESAGVTLVGGDLAALPRAFKLSEAVMTNIRQNLGFAFAYNLAGVPVAAGLLYPVLGWTLSPQIAAAAMAASSLSVVANALRLRTLKL